MNCLPLCCLCAKKSVRNNDEVSIASKNFHGHEENPMHDLVKNPTKIEEDLDDRILLWQNAVEKYEDYERYYMDKKGIKNDKQLHALRENPHAFLQDTDEDIVSLAKYRIDLQENEGILFQKFSSKIDEDSFYSIRTDRNSVQTVFSKETEDTNNAQMNSLLAKLTKIWSERLNTINPTQGSIDVVEPNSNNTEISEIKVTPKWPDFLTDVSYDVIKVNKYGHQMRRLLKLTQNHVVSIKNGCEITKYYRYGDIRRVGLKNSSTIISLLRSGKKNIYISPIAPHILQQLITRVQVRRSLDKANFKNSFEALGYNLQSAVEIIKSISEGNSLDAEAVMVNFANLLRERTVRSLSRDETKSLTSNMDQSIHFNNSSPRSESKKVAVENKNLDNNDYSSGQITSEVEITCRNEMEQMENQGYITEKSNEVIQSNTDNHAGPKLESSNQDIISSPLEIVKADQTQVFQQRSPMQFTFPENSSEFTLQKAVRKIVYDKETPEGNTRELFVEAFIKRVQANEGSINERLTEVRHFIDGIHEHMVSTRAFSLAILYQQDLQKSMIHSKRPSITNNTTLGSKFSLGRGKNAWRHASLRLIKNANLGVEQIDEDLLTIISFIIFTVVEEATFLPLKDYLVKLIVKDRDPDEESTLTEKMKYFSARSQSQWGIPDEFVSPIGWKSASFELNSMEHNLTPSFQLHVITRTMKAIFNEFKYAVLPSLRVRGVSENSVFISADDLVPIFLYVLCQSSLRQPLRNRDLMWALCHPDQLHGESGYYLTVYESALEFILNEPMERESFFINHGEIRRRTTTIATSRNVDSSNKTFISMFASLFQAKEQENMTMRESFN